MYYDYDFSEMVTELEALNETNGNIYTELQLIRQEQKEFFTETASTLTVISVILVVSIAVKVFFK